MLTIIEKATIWHEGDNIVIERVMPKSTELLIEVTYGTDSETMHTFELIFEAVSGDATLLRFKHANNGDKGTLFRREVIAFDISGLTTPRIDLYVNSSKERFSSVEL